MVALDDLRAGIQGDFLGACDTLYRIEPKGGGSLVPLRLWPEQRHLAAVMLRQQAASRPVRVVNLKTRRAGTSTFSEAWRFHHTHWTPRTRSLVIAHDDDTTDLLAGISRLMYDELPDPLRFRLRRDKKRMLEFDNRSQMQAATAGYVEVGRGRTIQHLHFSELDFAPDPPSTLAAVRETCHMEPGTSIVLESTAKSGDGWLASFWQASKAGVSGFECVFTAAQAVPGHRLPVPVDFEPTAEDRDRIARLGVDLPYLVWRRYKEGEFVAAEPWGGGRRFRREFPETEEDAFVSSGFCVFPDIVIARLKDGLRPPARAYHLVPTGDFDFEPVPTDADSGNLWVWKKREEGRLYALGVDVADGVRQTESVVSVCAWPGYEQVAEYASNTIAPDRLAAVVAWLSRRYGGEQALIVPEVNRSGVLVLYILNHLPLEAGLFRWRYFDKPGMRDTSDPKLGWSTTEETKTILTQVANLLYLRGDGTIRSLVLHEQMRRCVDVLPGLRWKVDGRSDRVLAWLIAQAGAYFDFEGGIAGGIGSASVGHPKDSGVDREIASIVAAFSLRPELKGLTREELQRLAEAEHRRRNWREKNVYDDDGDEIGQATGLDRSSYLTPADLLEEG